MIIEEQLKKELATTKNFLISIIENMPSGMVAIDLKGNVIAVNQHALNILRTDKLISQVIDMSINQLVDNLPILKKEVDAYRHEHKKSFDLSAMLIKDGMRETYINVKARQLVDGLLMVFEDVTKEREIDKSKSEFVSLASHELKTPLGIIKWYLEEILGDEMYKQFSDPVKEYLQDINKTNERVLDIVRSLLNVSRIDQGKVIDEPEKINVQNFINGSVSEMRIEGDKKAISIKVNFTSEFPEMIIDPKRFNEVIQNLLSNAIKYGKVKGEVKVEARSIDENLELKVIDNGIGIPEKDKSKLFTRFFRANNAVSSATEGTGLGLYVIKSYVEGWGGKIAVESTEGLGTTITLKIPFVKNRLN